MSAAPPPAAPQADPDHWAAVRALFERLQPLPEAERAARLADSGASTAVRSEVAALLGADDDAPDDFLSPPEPAQADPAEDTPARSGQRLGPWRLVGPLGRGGMGEVWLAERDDGAWHGEAAVKVLQRGMDSRAVLARFALERQALARLAHPHIARLLDAGVTPDGMPYFVMERVRGQPIDRACEGCGLADRLKLFLQLADAVAHAHRKLLLHRDLKPSNVLVDEAGEVKLLDFGIAKALGGGDGATAPGASGGEATAFGLRAFSPHYASPEHLRGEPVGTATDVFSLGVLLCEMLTGRRPHGDGATSALAAARAVLDEPPRAPSALFDAGRPQGQGLAAAELVGDIDAIVLRALEKSVDRRYDSVDAMAADLRAHLAGYPVSARPPRWWERAGRFARRNRWAVAAAALGGLGLGGGLASALLRAQAALALGLVASAAGLSVALLMLRRAADARELAEARQAELRQLVRALVFGHHDRIAMLPGSTETRERLLADAVRFLDRLVAPDAGVPEPGLAREAAEAYLRIAVLQGEAFSPSQERLADAEANLDKALALQPHYLKSGPLPLDALNAAADMWLARTTQRMRGGRLGAALQALEQARVLADRAVAQAPDDLQARSRAATVLGRVGGLLGNHLISAHLGRLPEAREPLERSLVAMRELQAAEPDEPEWEHQCAWAEQQLAVWRLLMGETDGAIALGRSAVARRDRAAALAPENAHFRHQRASVRSSLGQALSAAGQHDEADALIDEAGAIVRATAAADPANRSAARDVVMFDLVRARFVAQAALERDDARQLAAASAEFERLLAALPDADQAEDFYLRRWRCEARLWLVRCLPASEAARALQLARDTQAWMSGDDDNATRRWALALALGEQAQALARLGDAAGARAAAQAARAEWRATPMRAAPPCLRPWAARAEALADAPAPGPGAFSARADAP